jgi:hypothetical protein
MSMDPSTIQSLLVQQLGSKAGQPGTVGGGSGSPQMQGQTSGANLMAQLAQKAILTKALQGAQQQQQAQQASGMLPGTNAQVANDPTMQVLQQSPQLNPTTLAQLQQPAPIAPPGVPQQ